MRSYHFLNRNLSFRWLLFTRSAPNIRVSTGLLSSWVSCNAATTPVAAMAAAEKETASVLSPSVPGSRMVPLTSRKNLTSVIFRYREGEERFQITLTVKMRKFNFDRLLTEPTSTFLERVKANITKKVKSFNPETMPISFLIGSDEYSSSSSTPLPVSEIVSAGETFVKMRMGEDEVPVDVNPPEVTSIKFMKQCLVGFPILPVKIEGSSNWNWEKSQFLWEARPGDEKFPGIKARPKQRRPSKEIWSPKNSRSVAFTPEESDVNYYLRLTITPSDGTRLGEPITVEIPEAVAYPTTGLLFQERLETMAPLPNTADVPFRVISYNALAEMLTTPEWFRSSPKESLESDYRLPLLTAELKAYQGDILCLQEMEQKHFERYFSPFLTSDCGLQGILSLKTGEDAYEGVATFYNPSKFQLLESNGVNVGDQMKSLPFYESLVAVPGLIERLEERNTVLQIVTLKHVASGLRLLVANTHLYFKPDADHIRLLQTITCLKFLEEELRRVKQSNPNELLALLFCGDFNCTPPFASYRLTTSGRIAEDDPDWSSHETEKVTGITFEHKLNLVTAFPAEELTTIVINFEGCIDYIFYQPSTLRLLQRHAPPSKSQIAMLSNLSVDQLSLPNFQAPSDHIPIIADFCVDI